MLQTEASIQVDVVNQSSWGGNDNVRQTAAVAASVKNTQNNTTLRWNKLT